MGKPAYAAEAVDLYKFFGGFAAVRGVGFRVGWGEVYGLIGPNGAGKTTTLRILATLLKPTRGKALIAGHDTQKQPQQARKNTAYLPEEASPYERLTGYENLLFYARLYASSEEEARDMARRGAEISGLGDRLHDQASGYS
ncbi:MAG: ABC transporter ATP-binding protein, partial [Candidatus Korarchaeota archaeon]|nr:ABC transporter ATP-binding protein [Candidatus Korarchaeota archaeon]